MTDPALEFQLGQVSLGNTAFEGNNNSYVLGVEEDATTTLVDTGVATPAARGQLRDGLAEYGLEFADVELLLLTHFHADHAGLAGEVQAASGCPVYVHEADAPMVAQEPEAVEDERERTRRCLDEWGMPADKQQELLAFLEGGDDIQGDPPEVTTLTAGDRFDLGNVTLEAVHMPGHTAGLTGFAFDGRDGEELFSGDALLPYYTPNVGGADTRVEAALAKYLETLAAVVDRGYSRAWPGHRGAIIDPPGRAADIVVHHRERTRRVLAVLAEGPADPWTVSAELFGSLSSIHILHGPGEAYAHLAHLAEAGIVERDGREYVRLEDDPDLSGLFPDVTDGLQPDHIPGH